MAKALHAKAEMAPSVIIRKETGTTPLLGLLRPFILSGPRKVLGSSLLVVTLWNSGKTGLVCECS